MARFKIDENLPIEAAELLVAAGHDAVTVADQGMVGNPDTTLASVCQRESRAVVTLDLDFGDIRAYPPGDYARAATGVALRILNRNHPRITARGGKASNFAAGGCPQQSQSAWAEAIFFSYQHE